MFIHIGNDTVIQSEDVISIIDRNLISSSSIMEELMDAATANGIVNGPMDESKSVVITRDLIYLSTLSVTTLKKRTSMASMVSKLDDYAEDAD